MEYRQPVQEIVNGMIVYNPYNGPGRLKTSTEEEMNFPAPCVDVIHFLEQQSRDDDNQYTPDRQMMREGRKEKVMLGIINTRREKGQREPAKIGNQVVMKPISC